MKKIIAWLLVLALTAAISIGATLAYLTDTDEDVNVMTLGKIKIDQLEYERVDDESKDADATVQEFHDNKPLLPAVTDKNFDYTPGDTYVDWTQIGKDGYTSDIWDPSKINNEQDKMVFIKNKGDYDAFVRTVFAFEAGKYTTLTEFRNMVHLNLNETDYTWEWVETPVEIPNAEGGTTKYFVATATYNKVLAPGALTEISLSQIALDKTATNEDVEAFGETYQILVKTQGIQADGFDNAIMALNEGFDMIDASNIPWETDAPTKGGTVYNALHYLNADINDTNISKNVKNVVFGLNQNYAEIVNAYEGALVDVEQDIPVYAYYVPNDNGYDVYLLANDKIYTPKNSTELFQGMTALVSIDTTNMETGRTEIFTGFLKDCNALTTVTGIENWDTSKATMMDQMFNNCFVLDNLDLKKWNVTNVTNMKNMFRYCYALKNFDASTWYLPNVGDMAQMFLNCKSLEELDINSWRLGKAWRLYATFGSCEKLKTVNVADWDTSTITDMTGAFQFCVKLESVDVSKWDTSNVTSTGHMFRACISLTELDIADWDVSNVTSFTAMFQGNGSNAMDMKIKALDLSKWTPNSAVHMNHMFYGCAQLTELDLSGWNMPNLYTTSHMFADCTKLEVIDVSGWQTSDAWLSMDAMFNDCRKVKTLDVSSFTTSGVAEFSQIFEACWALEEIIGLENWDTSNGKSFDETFLSCGSLKELNLSSWNTGSATVNYTHLNKDTSKGFKQTFSGTSSLNKLILGANFDYDGDGTVSHKTSLPNPAAKTGYTAMWRNVETGELYLASEIPAMTAATYEAYYRYNAKGAKLVDALNYLNANSKGTNITTKVSSITFGLKSDYEEISNNYTGVLADSEQDVPVYAYYVENNGLYHVYLLAEDTIYLPENSTKLCNGMSNLTTMEVDNLSTERTTSLRGTFQGCNRLAELDVSNWDTSNVTDMAALFNNCNALNLIGYENWDTSSLENALYLFQNTLNMTQLDLSGWDVSNLTTAEYMFFGCSNLTSVDTTGWKLTDLNSAVCMFYACQNLTEIKGIENWGLGKATDLHHMFYQCNKLDNIDISDWDVSTVKDFRYLFGHASSLSELDLSDWDVSSAQNMTHMFYNCPNLEKLNAAGWNTSKVTDFSHMFASASQNAGNIKLNELNVTGWDTGSATTMVSMFYGCGNLTELDLSSWDVSNVKTMSHMFADCFKLSNLNLQGWDTSSLEVMDCMFNDCDALITLDVSMFDTHNVKEFSQIFDDCENLVAIIGLTNWNTANGCVFEEMFQGCEKLTTLDLSSIDTRNARDNYKASTDTYDAFVGMFSNMTSLEKLILSENFVFDGNGSVTIKATMPAPAAKEGFVAKWRNVETGVTYLASEIPSGVAATYEAYYEAISIT